MWNNVASLRTLQLSPFLSKILLRRKSGTTRVANCLTCSWLALKSLALLMMIRDDPLFSSFCVLLSTPTRVVFVCYFIFAYCWSWDFLQFNFHRWKSPTKTVSKVKNITMDGKLLKVVDLKVHDFSFSSLKVLAEIKSCNNGDNKKFNCICIIFCSFIKILTEIEGCNNERRRRG